MGMAISNGTDVIGFLKAQHEQVKALFGQVLSSAGKERAQAFFTLRRMMAIHETAEEEIVHPAARRSVPGGDAIVDARLKEENKAKKALAELESMDLMSSQFETKLRALQTDVLAHAESEEQQEFNQLATRLEPAVLAKMRRAVQLAESMAPTRPHAGIESQAANLLAGPFAAMLDRARDALSGKTPKTELPS